MAPEYGATCGFFPVDDETLNYLRLTGREDSQIALVEAYSKAQGLWREPGDEPIFTDTLSLDMNEVEASLAGPKRPQDRVALKDMVSAFGKVMEEDGKALPSTEKGKLASEGGQTAVGIDRSYEHDFKHSDSQTVTMGEQDFSLDPGAVVIAAITSCTNTSNPSVMMAAGLLARNAREKGLTTKPWVKTSLAPGSKVVTDYLAAASLDDDLDALGFNLVGYGCTTCIGNSGPLPEEIEKAINNGDLTVASVLSGNRNFEGRVHPPGQNQLAGIAAPGRCLCTGGQRAVQLDHRPARPGQRRQPGVSERHLAFAGRYRQRRREGEHRDVPQGVRCRLRRR